MQGRQACKGRCGGVAWWQAGWIASPVTIRLIHFVIDYLETSPFFFLSFRWQCRQGQGGSPRRQRKEEEAGKKKKRQVRGRKVGKG